MECLLEKALMVGNPMGAGGWRTEKMSTGHFSSCQTPRIETSDILIAMISFHVGNRRHPAKTSIWGLWILCLLRCLAAVYIHQYIQTHVQSLTVCRRTVPSLCSCGHFFSLSSLLLMWIQLKQIHHSAHHSERYCKSFIPSAVRLFNSSIT